MSEEATIVGNLVTALGIGAGGVGGGGGLYLVLTRLMPMIQNGRRENSVKGGSKKLSVDSHNAMCKDRLEPIKDQLEKNHDDIKERLRDIKDDIKELTR